jgi:uncharacterized protein YjbJ (UPF0337 family)
MLSGKAAPHDGLATERNARIGIPLTTRSGVRFRRRRDNRQETTMDENQFEGAARNIGGKIQDAVGGLTGDTATQARGKVNQAAGQAQQMYGAAVDDLKNFTSEQPMMALLAAMGVGVVLGFILGRN